MEARSRAESIKSELLAERPDLYVEVEPNEPITLRICGAEELFSQQIERAREMSADDDIILKVEDKILCSRSAHPKPTRELDEPVAGTPSPVEEDKRGVWLLCKNEDGHTPHDWGSYTPLK